MRKDDLIKRILDVELKMFLNVPTVGKARCQEDPDSFRMVRKAQFMTWSEKTLESYLQDLQVAESQKGKVKI